MKIIHDDFKKCIGCEACVDICPKHCISMGIINNNFTAIIDSSQCIQCQLCSKVCQINHPPQCNNLLDCYAAWNDEERKTSSSGGIGASIAKYIIRQGGICIGCVLENNEVKHTVIEKEEDILKLKGSKYVKSEMQGVYRLIKDNKTKKICIFGTPCIIAGVKKYCETNKIIDKDFLYIDLICHGTPNQYILKDIIKNNRLKAFRSNNNFELVYSNTPNKDTLKYSELYIIGFLNGMFYNEACYNCPYTNLNRNGDITIGDFWGIKGKDEKEIEKGISLVLINSSKGEAIFNNLDIYKEKHNIEEALVENEQLKRPALPHKNHSKFLRLYYKDGKESLRKLLRKDIIIKRIKNIINSNKFIRSTIKKIVRK